MTCVSTFSGIGGIDIAAHAAGFRTVAFVERDRFCRAVLAHHWPGVPQFDDIVDFGERHAAQFVGVDLLHGGFPCQDISAAGLGAGLTGARSGLWFAMLDCIGRIRPRFVLAENVGSLRSRGIDTVLGGLESAGYAANALVVAAEDMGAPHRRERVFIVGERLGDATQRQDKRARHAGRDGEELAISGRPSGCSAVADATGLPGGSRRRDVFASAARGGVVVADADGAGREQLRSAEPGGEFLASSERGCGLADPARQRCGEAWADSQRSEERLARSGEVADGHPGYCDRRGRAWDGRAESPDGSGRRPKSRLGRGADGLPAGLDRCTAPAWPARPGEAQHEWEPPRLTTKGGRGTNRAARLKALGNAVVPAQVYPILAAMAGRLREESTR